MDSNDILYEIVRRARHSTKQNAHGCGTQTKILERKLDWKKRTILRLAHDHAVGSLEFRRIEQNALELERIEVVPEEIFQR